MLVGLSVPPDTSLSEVDIDRLASLIDQLPLHRSWTDMTIDLYESQSPLLATVGPVEGHTLPLISVYDQQATVWSELLVFILSSLPSLVAEVKRNRQALRAIARRQFMPGYRSEDDHTKDL